MRSPELSVHDHAGQGPEPAVAAAILAMVRRRTGVDLEGYRRPTVLRRLRGRMAGLGVQSFDEYHALLEARHEEAFSLLERVTIKVSRFYRNRDTFDLLRDALPALAARRAGSPVRVWSAGCANGEEAYTLAMLLDAHGIRGFVVATDVDPSALACTAAGEYPAASMSELPPSLAERYVEPLTIRGSGAYRIRGTLRRRVCIWRHDLTAGTPAPAPGTFDLIACRNVLIYLAPDRQRRALGVVRGALAHGGVLCLGEAEWPHDEVAASLEVLSRPCRVFRADDSGHRRAGG